MKRHAFALLLAISSTSFVALTPTVAHAQAVDAAAADALFQKGREAADKGDYAAAAAKFAESQRLDPAPGTLLNLADCEEHLGQTASAWEHYKRAAETMSAGDDRIPYAKQKAAALEKSVAHLTLVAGPDLPSNANVTRDDVQLGSATFGLSLPTNPGAHTVVVTATGHKEKRFNVTLKPGESQTLSLTTGDGDAAAAQPEPAPSNIAAVIGTPAPASAEPHKLNKKTIGYALGGVGIAAVLVGGVAGVLVLQKKSEVSDHCDATKACDQAGLDAADSGKTFSTVSTVAFAAGAVALGAGAYLLLTSKDDSSSSGVVARIAPAPLPGGGGLHLIGTF